MATPSGTNQVNPGTVRANGGFLTGHGKGILVTAVDTDSSDSTTVVNFFGTTNGFAGVITGIFLVALDATAANITVTNGGLSVAVIAKGTSAGVLVGATTLSNTTIGVGGTMAIFSSAASGRARVFVTYKITEPS